MTVLSGFFRMGVSPVLFRIETLNVSIHGRPGCRREMVKKMKSGVGDRILFHLDDSRNGMKDEDGEVLDGMMRLGGLMFDRFGNKRRQIESRMDRGCVTGI